MKTPKNVSRWPNGEPICVLRPLKPDVSLAFAKVAMEHNSVDALSEAVTHGPCKFLGFLVKTVAVDENGKNPIKLEPGDVFVEPSSMEQLS